MLSGFIDGKRPKPAKPQTPEYEYVIPDGEGLDEKFKKTQEHYNTRENEAKLDELYNSGKKKQK